MKLVDVMGLEYSRSKKWFNWTIGLSLTIQLLTILSIFLVSGAGLKMLAAIAAFGQIVLFFCRRGSKYHFGLAEEIRRLAMLQDGLNIQPSEDQMASIWERVGDPNAAKPFYLGPYYESESPKSHKRLIEITRESAFFTTSLARKSAIAFGIMAGLGLAATMGAFIAVVQAGTFQQNLDMVSKAVVASMVFWVTGDLMTMALQFYSLAKTAGRVQTQCAHLLSKSTGIKDEAHTIAGEYNCSLVQAPPIPDWIYKWRQDILNEAWKNRRAPASSSNAT